MTWDQIAGPLRAILPAVAAFAIAKGWINTGNADWLISSILAAGAAVWSIWSNRPAAQAAAAQATGTVNVQVLPTAPASVANAVAAVKATQ